MADSRPILYTTDPCGFCRQAKAMLESRGLDYVEVNLSKDPQGRADLVARTGQLTFPQLVVAERESMPACSESTTASRSAASWGRLSVPTGRSGWIRARKSASSA